jgi:hypothetical protein
VALYFLRPVVAQALQRFSLDQLVDEVRRFIGPAWRHLVLADLNLSFKDVVPDLLSAPTVVWSSPEHALVSNDAHCIIVNTDPMVLFAHDLRCHVARGSTRFIFVVLRPNPSNAEIGNFQITL